VTQNCCIRICDRRTKICFEFSSLVLSHADVAWLNCFQNILRHCSSSADKCSKIMLLPRINRHFIVRVPEDFNSKSGLNCILRLFECYEAKVLTHYFL
jgi:hypothetical protein